MWALLPACGGQAAIDWRQDERPVARRPCQRAGQASAQRPAGGPRACTASVRSGATQRLAFTRQTASGGTARGGGGKRAMGPECMSAHVGISSGPTGAADCLHASPALGVCGTLAPALQRRQAGNIWGLHAWSCPGRPGSSSMMKISCVGSDGQLGLHECRADSSQNLPKGRAFLRHTRWREGGPVFSCRSTNGGACSSSVAGRKSRSEPVGTAATAALSSLKTAWGKSAHTQLSLLGGPCPMH